MAGAPIRFQSASNHRRPSSTGRATTDTDGSRTHATDRDTATTRHLRLAVRHDPSPPPADVARLRLPHVSHVSHTRRASRHARDARAAAGNGELPACGSFSPAPRGNIRHRFVG